jgi:hypothetical protein
MYGNGQNVGSFGRSVDRLLENATEGSSLMATARDFHYVLARPHDIMSRLKNLGKKPTTSATTSDRLAMKTMANLAA